jgi:SAM-dependent methyltransferase
MRSSFTNPAAGMNSVAGGGSPPRFKAAGPRMTARQRIRRGVVRQFGRPRGLPGYLVGWVMAHRSSNRRRSFWVVSLLGVQATDRVLEIGFGPGIAIEALSRAANRGLVYGIDHSEVMLRMATKRNAAAIRAGRVHLVRGSVENLAWLEAPLDAILAINSLGFWPEPISRLKELQTKLRTGGRIAIASQPRCPGATLETSELVAQEIKAMLNEAGFSELRIETLPLSPPVVCVLGIKDESSRQAASTSVVATDPLVP